LLKHGKGGRQAIHIRDFVKCLEFPSTKSLGQINGYNAKWKPREIV